MSLRAIFEAGLGGQWLASRFSAVTDVQTAGYARPGGSQTPLQAAQASLPRLPAIRVDISKSITLQDMHTRMDQMRAMTDEMTKGVDQPGYERPAPINTDISGGVLIPFKGKAISKGYQITAADIAEAGALRQQSREANERLMSEYRVAVAAYQTAYDSVKPS